MAKTTEMVFDTLDEPIFVDKKGIILHTCCHCKSRHVWVIDTFLYKKRPIAEINIFPDENGTKLRRFYERKKGRKKP